MLPILAGLFLWAFVFVDLTVAEKLEPLCDFLLLVLGSVLMCISFIERVRINLASIEIVTRRVVRRGTEWSKIDIFHYVSYAIFVILLFLAVLVSILPPPPTRKTRSGGKIIYEYIDFDISTITWRLTIWFMIFGSVALIAIIVINWEWIRKFYYERLRGMSAVE